MPNLEKVPLETLTLEQRRVIMVLGRLIALVQKGDEDLVDGLVNSLDNMVDDLNSDEYFGKKGQRDPRGDFRKAEWSMECVQGIDQPEDANDDSDDDDDEGDGVIGSILTVAAAIVLGT